MASKLANLQSALDNARTGANTPRGSRRTDPQAVAAPAAPPTPAARQASRAKKVNIAAWMDPAFKSSLRLVQARRPGHTIQDLLEEALNDLFAKYDVPQVTPEQP